MSRPVAVVIGQALELEKLPVIDFWKEGAHVVCADFDSSSSAKPQMNWYRKLVGIGVAGTGLSSCGPTLARTANMTDRDSVHRLFDDVVLAYGGMDTLIVTAEFSPSG